MKKFLLITILICGLFLVSCSQGVEDGQVVKTEDVDLAYDDNYEFDDNYIEESSSAETSLENLPDPVMLSADFSVVNNGDGTFVIETNLPDETELMLTLTGRAYIGQSKAYVEGGVAVSERFTNKGKQLIGDYELEVLMPIPSVQTDYVKHFIGDDGEYLTGPYIKPSLGSIVVTKTFDVSFDLETKQNTEITVEASTTEEEHTHTEGGKYYRTPTGKKYHLDPTCGGKNSYSISDKTGLSACDKCAK